MNSGNFSITIRDTLEVLSDFDAIDSDNSTVVIDTNGVALFQDDVLGNNNSDQMTFENHGYVFINDDLRESPTGGNA